MTELCLKIVWDSGEYIVQNVDNYSYEIIDPYFEGCGNEYNVYGTFLYAVPVNAFIKCNIKEWVQDSYRSLFSSSRFSRKYNPSVVPAIQEFTNSNYCSGYVRLGYKYTWYTDEACTNLVTTYYFPVAGMSATNYQIDFFEIETGQPPPIKLKIIDGGIEHLYSINDKNSVQVVEYECGCPPNQLDCGDCCLDCNSTFNQISEIRSLVSRIR